MSTHRWPRAATVDDRWGPLCDCGSLKTDQALTCADCAAERRLAVDHWERRTCACSARQTKNAAMCRPCRNDAMRNIPCATGPQPASHPWRKAETARVARILAA